jgi:transcriptional regulator with XRE-family HTH domain
VPTTAETFAANLRRLRLERGLTQEQLALEAGLTMAKISEYEAQKLDPRFASIDKLSAALDVEPGELFAGI